ncbi:MAG: hypothetical protein V4547_19505 [Bacteroidota bacterium]
MKEEEEKESTLKIMLVWALILFVQYIGSSFIFLTLIPWHHLIEKDCEGWRAGFLVLLGFNYMMTCMGLMIVPFVHVKMRNN